MELLRLYICTCPGCHPCSLRGYCQYKTTSIDFCCGKFPRLIFEYIQYIQRLSMRHLSRWRSVEWVSWIPMDVRRLGKQQQHTPLRQINVHVPGLWSPYSPTPGTIQHLPPSHTPNVESKYFFFHFKFSVFGIFHCITNKTKKVNSFQVQ